MTLTIADGFNIYLGWITPSESERSHASLHRASIKDKLDSRFGLWRMYESGSWKHGTGVSGKSDVDYFISLKTNKTAYGSTILNSVKEALQERFPSTQIYIRRPAVVLDFNGGNERVELIPAFPDKKLNSGFMRYDIPGVADEWIQSAPEAHLAYVSAANSRTEVRYGAKHLARLAKSWKYECNVPISSFYIEMRASQYMNNEKSVIYDVDLKRFF